MGRSGPDEACRPQKEAIEVKAKLTFDKAVVLDFLAQNAEKILFGVVVVCFLFFVYRAFGWPRYDKTPDDLTNVATSAAEHIRTRPANVDKAIKDYRAEIERSGKPIAGDPYEFVAALDNPVFDPLSKRGEPILHTVEGLRGAPGLGRLAQQRQSERSESGAESTTEPLGTRWVVLTGVVNYDKYRKSFVECFQDAAVRREGDFEPIFIDYQVQRAEVTDDSQDLATLDWQWFYKNLGDEFKRFPEMRSGVTPQSVRDPALTFPLPERTDRDWGEEVVHAPEIPLPRIETASESAVATAASDASAEPPIASDGPGGLSQRSSGEPGGFREATSSRERRDDSRRSDEGRSSRRRTTAAAAQTAADDQPYRLFRFFDYRVEPGKRYRYRVRLRVENPNYGVSPEDVNREIRQRMEDKENWKPYLTTDWSEPSDVVTIPPDDRLLAVSVKPPGRNEIEPTARIRAIHWDMQSGIEIADEFDIPPGTLVNLLDQEVPEQAIPPVRSRRDDRRDDRRDERRDEERTDARDLLIGGDTRASRRRPPVKRGEDPEAKKVDYRTEMLLLDVEGGSPLPGKNAELQWPGKLLLLTPDGQLQVRTDVEDRAAY